MMLQIGGRRTTVLGAGIACLVISGAAHAQGPSEAAEINRCLCLRQEIAQLSAEMSAKMGALRSTDERLSDLDAQLRRERPGLDVNDPAAVEHYKALLEERDSTWNNSVGAVWTAANDAVARYNGRVRDYDDSCVNRPFSPALAQPIGATLTCQAPGYPPTPAYRTPPGPPASAYPPAPAYPPPPAPSESQYPPAPAYGTPPAPPESQYPPAPGYGTPPAPSESQYPPAPGYGTPPAQPESQYPPAPTYGTPPAQPESQYPPAPAYGTPPAQPESQYPPASTNATPLTPPASEYPPAPTYGTPSSPPESEYSPAPSYPAPR
jgi:hypothetical protein